MNYACQRTLVHGLRPTKVAHSEGSKLPFGATQTAKSMALPTFVSAKIYYLSKNTYIISAEAP